MTNIFKLEHLKNDLPASVVVFLVALPLCLGIALASGAPLMSGVISGIVGGIVVGWLSGSQTSVSGPAAGLAAVVLSGITQLGSFEVFLLAVALAGVMQLGLGLAGAGFIANYVPSNVIKGLLAAIGIILITKQIPHAVGYDSIPEGDMSFRQSDGQNMFSELVHLFQERISWGAALVSGISILALVYWDKTPLGRYKYLPAPLFVVLFGVLANWLYGIWAPSLAIGPEHLVSLPVGQDWGALLTFPKFGAIVEPGVWSVALMVAMVASLETLLNIEAVDKIDPHKRESPPNRELLAQGVGNLASGLLGGIPLTSVIVRSSVNIQMNNSTKLSSILHGVFMLAAVLFFARAINLIPLSSLAAILLVTGYKLAKVELFRKMFAKGWTQFLPFVVTILAIIFTDLMLGVVIGLSVSAFFILRDNYHSDMKLEENQYHVGEVIRIELSEQVSFLNKASIKETLWSIPNGSKVIIDAQKSDFIDPDVLELLEDFRDVVAKERGISLNMVGLRQKYQLHDHIQFLTVLDEEQRMRLSPKEVLQLLEQGNERFREGRWNSKYYQHQVNATSMGRNPMALIIGSIDSRTTPEVIMDAHLGDLLTIRVAGPVLGPEVVGSVEIAVRNLGVKLIVVKGHSNCGTVSLALEDVREGNIAWVTDKVRQAIAEATKPYPLEKSPENIEALVRLNTSKTVETILGLSPYIRERIQGGQLGIVTAYYRIETGKIEFSPLVALG